MTNESPWAIIGAFTEELTALNRVREAEGQNAFVARLFVRSLFSIFDGYAYYLKQQALSRAARVGVVFTPTELEKLTELRQARQGETAQKPKILPTGENLLFACKTFARVYDAVPPLVNDALPPQFAVAADVRNRITHPKKPSDFNVSAEELRAIGGLIIWFQALMIWVKDQELNLIETIKGEIRQTFEEARARHRQTSGD